MPKNRRKSKRRRNGNYRSLKVKDQKSRTRSQDEGGIRSDLGTEIGQMK